MACSPAAVDRRDAAAAIVHDHDLARAIEQIVEPRLERGLRAPAGGGWFLPARGRGDSNTAATPIDDDGKRGDEPDPPGCVESSVKDTTKGAVKGRLYHEIRDGHHFVRARCGPRCRRARTPIRRGLRIEMDRVFARMWLAAGRAPISSTTPGAFIRRDVAGASVLIVRARGRIDSRAFHNVCRHRGTRLCTEERGTFQGSIQCPYHAWTYGLDGRLLAAPQMDEVDGFDRSAIIRCARSRARRGTATSSSTLPIRPRRWPRSSANCRRALRRGAMQELRLVHRIEYDVATNWKLVVQNYNECLHCPVIHPLLNRMHHYLGAENVPTTETYCGGAMGFKDGVETLSTDGKRRREFLPGLGGRDRDGGQLLRDLSELPADAASRLHDDDHDLAAGLRADEARRRMAFPSRRDREAGFRVRGCDRVLGSHQSRGLGDLRAVVSRDQLTRLSAGAVLRAREAAVGVRSVRPVTDRATEARRSRS